MSGGPKTGLFQQAQDRTQGHSRVLKAAYSYLRLKQEVLGKWNLVRSRLGDEFRSKHTRVRPGKFRAFEGQGHEPVIYGGIYTHFCRALSVQVTFLDAAGIYPEVSKTISRSLVRAELYLPPPSLALAGARLYILKADLFVIVC